jgi:hypothetical protein
MRNVLVFPAGTEIGLEIYAALYSCKEVKLFAAGQAVSNHAELLYEKYYSISSIYSDKWLEELICIVEELNIDYIFPAYDDVIIALSKNREKIPATIHVHRPQQTEGSPKVLEKMKQKIHDDKRKEIVN